MLTGKMEASNIASLLTPRAIAYWLSGDGNYSKRDKAILFCTHSFTPEELDQLRSDLLDKYGIESTRLPLIKLRSSIL
jgi:hypothetical protein